MAQTSGLSRGKVEKAANDVADRIDDSVGAEGGATTADIQAEIDRLRQDIANLTQTLASFGTSKIRQAGETSQQYVDTARDTISDLEKEVEAHVKARPFRSLAIAAGVGYLLAVLSRR